MRYSTDETAAAAAEYALILAMIAAAIIVALTDLGGGIGNVVNTVNAAIAGA